MKICILSLLATVIVFLSCKTNNELINPTDTVEMSIEKARSIFTNKVTVTAELETNPKSLEKKFQEYALKYRGMSSKSQNMMAFTFDDSTISSPKLISLLKNEKEIIDAIPLRKAQTKVTSIKSSDRKNGVLTK